VKSDNRKNDFFTRFARLDLIARLTDLLPVVRSEVDWTVECAAIWESGPLRGRLLPCRPASRRRLEDLLGIDDQKSRLDANTKQFVRGFPANNALLWGARGTGKSSLVHALLERYADEGLRLIQVDKRDLGALPEVVDRIGQERYRYLVFSDDLSFTHDDTGYKVLKSILDGSIFGLPDNVLIYATSNRRHLVSEYASDNEQAEMVDGELHEQEATGEKISLSDRFGLWISFHPFNQDDYLQIVRHWIETLAGQWESSISWNSQIRAEALRWALGRGIRSGRTAYHFACHRVGQTLESHRTN